MKKIALAGLLFLHFSLAHAGFWSGNQLYGWIQNSATRSMGTTFITGVADNEGIHYFFARLDGKAYATAFFCLPEEVTAGQITDIVQKYFADHPSTRHLDAALLTRSALIEAYPCSTNPRR